MAEIYEQLAEKLDGVALGAPKSGELLRILERLFGPEEAEIALALPFRPAPLARIARSLGRAERELGERLEAMADQGLVYARDADRGPYYALLPILPGMFELQFMTGERDASKTWLARLYEDYYQRHLGRAMAGKKTGFARVLPVEREIPRPMEIFPYEKVSTFIEEGAEFALTTCHCRHQKQLIGEGCTAPTDVCMLFGPFAAFAVERGFARRTSRAEMRAALDRAEEHGLIHVSDNVAERINFLCNCCGCCCGFLRAATAAGKANVVAASRYVVTLDRDACVACGTCVERCQMGALALETDHVAVVGDRCLGCGVCVGSCASGALSLDRRTGFAPPLRTRAELDAELARQRDG